MWLRLQTVGPLSHQWVMLGNNGNPRKQLVTLEHSRQQWVMVGNYRQQWVTVSNSW